MRGYWSRLRLQHDVVMQKTLPANVSAEFLDEKADEQHKKIGSVHFGKPDGNMLVTLFRYLNAYNRTFLESLQRNLPGFQGQ